MSDIVERLKLIDGWIWYKDDTYIDPPETPNDLADEIVRLRAERDEACRYAERLATILATKHWPEADQWRPLTGDIIGLLTQIDNATAGLVRAALKGDKP